MLASLAASMVEATFGGSIRHGAFIRGERLIQTLYHKGGQCSSNTRRLFESGRLLEDARGTLHVSYIHESFPVFITPANFSRRKPSWQHSPYISVKYNLV